MIQNKYSVIVFDLGNVLIPFNYDLIFQKLEKIEKNLGEKFLKFYNENYNIHRAFERGDLTEKNFLKKVLTSLQNKINEETFCNYYSKIFTVNEDVVSLLPKLKEIYTLVLLSNTNSIHKKYGWENYDFLKYFDKLILSYEVNANKPEEKIYRAVEEFTKMPSKKHFFIDDVLEYVNAAKEIGWNAVQFINYQKLLEDLKKNGIYSEKV